jgi:hypothetical protein
MVNKILGIQCIIASAILFTIDRFGSRLEISIQSIGYASKGVGFDATVPAMKTVDMYLILFLMILGLILLAAGILKEK